MESRGQVREGHGRGGSQLCPLQLTGKRDGAESQPPEGTTVTVTSADTVLGECWRKADWGHLGENVGRGNGHSKYAQLGGGVLLQTGAGTGSHSWQGGVVAREGS